MVQNVEDNKKSYGSQDVSDFPDSLLLLLSALIFLGSPRLSFRSLS